MTNIDPTSLPVDIDIAMGKALLNHPEVQFIDIREQYEYDAGHIVGITLLPMSQIQNRMGEIPKDKTVIISCQTGIRSDQVVQYLRAIGYNNVHNMAGGFANWRAARYPVE